MNTERVAFGWGANSHYGWGVIGLNWMLHWPGTALTAMPDLAAELPPSDERGGLLNTRVRESVAVQRGLAERPGQALDIPAFVALGNDFISQPVVGGLPLHGTPTVAMPVFEDLVEAEKSVERLKGYPLVIAASAWNREWLEDRGIPAVLCHQGYDPVLFHPGVRRTRDDGRFRVFSGGKAEYRKGQDIVLAAFARFAERHDDAVLVAAWGSPWPGMAKSFAAHGIEAPPGSEIGLPNFRAWAQRAGIKPHQIEIVSPRPNWRMAEVYGGVDCAVFPNRCEGGTNLVAMECMACGVPLLLSMTAGQGDLSVPHFPGWCYAPGSGELIDAYVGGLETAYAGAVDSIALGPEWAWPARLAELTSILRDL